MSQGRRDEVSFETVIEAHLLANGYLTMDQAGFDRDQAIFPKIVLGFIRETQANEWKKLEALHGERTGEQIIGDLCKWMDTYGSLTTLRHGFKCYERTLRVAAERTIGLLKERRAALISAAVTGKIKSLSSFAVSTENWI